MPKFKKKQYILICSILFFAAVIIILSGPVLKHFVTKNDETYTGRRITLGRTFVNPFTGLIHFRNLIIYEHKSDSIFFSADGVKAKIAMLKLLTGTFEIRKITLNHPAGIIAQNNKYININDLIDKFSSKPGTAPTKNSMHFNILSIKIIDGEFHYHEKLIPIDYFIKNVNIESKGKRWDSDTIAGRISFMPGIGTGDLKGDFTINFRNNDYRFACVTHKFDLSIIGQYLKDLSNYGSFSANIDADVKVKGNFDDRENLEASGKLAINELHFGKNPDDDFAAFHKMKLTVIKLDRKNNKYLFDSLWLDHPYLKYERYDYLDNVQTMFGVKGANIKAASGNQVKFNLVIEIARYIKILADNFFKSDYKVNHLGVNKGNLEFNDFSTNDKFAVELNPVTIIADSVDKSHRRVNFSLKSIIKPYGNVSAELSINPKDSADFDLQYNFQKLPVTLFNPYIISYTSFPLDRGTIEVKGTWNVRKGVIKSINHLVIVDPRISKRIRNKDTKWLPVPLIMTFIRERGNVIDYEIPITGNLKNPKFHLKDVILDLLGNIFVKPPSVSYGMQVKNAEAEIEKSLTLKWEMRQSSLLPVEKKFIYQMADFLIKNPDATINVSPQQYETKEKEHILFFEAKKKYFGLTHNINVKSIGKEDSATIDKMSVKDSLFVHYLNKQKKDPLIFSIQEKCTGIIDSATVNNKFEVLRKEREKAFIACFIEKGVKTQVKFYKGENIVPYNGFSFYKIEYKGEFPSAIIKAYQEMNELNNEAPRKLFLQERKKNEVSSTGKQTINK